MARRTDRCIAPVALSLSFAAAGCTSVQQVQADGRVGSYDISCGYFGWYICYERAAQLCPSGYKVVSESEEHFGGRKLRISCEEKK